MVLQNGYPSLDVPSIAIRLAPTIMNDSTSIGLALMVCVCTELQLKVRV